MKNRGGRVRGEERTKRGVETEQYYTAHLYFIQRIVRERRLMEV